MTDMTSYVIAMLHDVREDQRDRYEDALKAVSEQVGGKINMRLVRRGVIMLSNLMKGTFLNTLNNASSACFLILSAFIFIFYTFFINC